MLSEVIHLIFLRGTLLVSSADNKQTLSSHTSTNRIFVPTWLQTIRHLFLKDFMTKDQIGFRTVSIIYLENKETQQTLRVIVSIQYDASFSANDIYP